MTKKKSPRGPYEVGYAKPPKDRRFKPGQSGNKKGRPKGSPNLHSVLEEELRQKIPVKIDGREHHLPVVKALVKRVVHGALAGNPKNLEMLLKLIALVPAGQPPEASEEFELSETERLLLQEAYGGAPLSPARQRPRRSPKRSRPQKA